MYSLHKPITPLFPQLLEGFFKRQIIFFSESWQIIYRDESTQHGYAHLNGSFIISIIKAESLSSILKGHQLLLIISSTPKCFLLKCMFCCFWCLKVVLNNKYYFHFQSNRWLLLKQVKINKSRKKEFFKMLVPGGIFFNIFCYISSLNICRYVLECTHMCLCRHIYLLCVHVCTVCITHVIYSESSLYYFLNKSV